MRRADLAARYELNAPVSPETIREVERVEGFAIPPDFVALLEVTNGLNTGERLVLLELEALVARNRDYEVGEYLPGYVMIGDDGGGTAILMRANVPTVFEVGMGAMDMETLRVSAPSLEVLLIEPDGRTLDERP